MSRMDQNETFPDWPRSKIKSATSLMGSGSGVSSIISLIGEPEILTPTAIAFIRNTIDTAVAFSTSLHFASRFSIPSRFAYGCSAVIDPIYDWIKSLNYVSEEEMMRVFNCGFGMLIFISPDEAEKLGDNDEYVVLGKVTDLQ